MNSLGLILGVFLVPLTMLVVCHRFRRLSWRQRRTFWGLAAGYGIALVLVLLMLLAPPVQWVPEQPVRTFLIYWGLFLIPALGSLAGFLLSGAANKPQLES